MGIEHFNLMYEAALELDCRALVEAMAMVYGPADAINCGALDKAMRLTRKLIKLHDETFIAELRELIAEGRITMRTQVLPVVKANATPEQAAYVAMAASIYPPMAEVKNPHYLGSDCMQCTPDEFYSILEQ